MVFNGGGLAPSGILGSGRPCKDSVAVACFCPSCCDGPLVWELLIVSATIFVAVAIVVAETWMVFGVVVV